MVRLLCNPAVIKLPTGIADTSHMLEERPGRGRTGSGHLGRSPRRTVDVGRRERLPLDLVAKTLAVAIVVVVGLAAAGVTPGLSFASPASHPTGHAAPRPVVSAAVRLNPAPPATIAAQAAAAARLHWRAPTTAAHPTSASTVQPAPVPSTAPPTTTTPAPPPPVSTPGVIQASGTHLTLNGSVYRFTGVNAYEAATLWGTNAGCGGELSDTQLNQLFASLPPNSLVRFWAFQGSMATDVTTHQLNWGPLDRVFAAAAAHGQRLVVAVTDQGGTCDGGHWQDPAWYQGGFMNVYNDPSTTDGRGLTPLSYWTYLQDIVARYRTSPALGMWEPVSEAEASTCPPQFEPTNCSGHQTCVNETVAAAALRHFFDVVGGEIHALDPKHLVESGLLAGSQCSSQGQDYLYVSASPGIDVLSYHDYYGLPAVGGDYLYGIAVRLAQAAALHKPIIGGEVGVQAGNGPGCTSTSTRNAVIAAKAQAQEALGSSGILTWNWVPTTTYPCTYDVTPTDPVVSPGGAVG